jgi:hypothetical protein
LNAACRAADELAEAVGESFLHPPDAYMLMRIPGPGVQFGVRALAEVGDDRDHFADSRALKA